MTRHVNCFMVPSAITRQGEADSQYNRAGQHHMRELARTYSASIIYADDFPDGISKVISACKGEKAFLKTLTLFDHAASDHIAMGSSDYGTGDFRKGTSVAHKDRQGHMRKVEVPEGEARAQFSRLKSLFNGAGFIVLRGCELGGGSLPLLISQVVPIVVVVAFYDKQNIIGAVQPNGNSVRWKNGRALGVWNDTDDMPNMY